MGLSGLLANTHSLSQPIVFRRDTTVSVTAYGRTLANAWAGGLNAPQFSSVRLNADTVPDLVAFDRTNGQLSTFVATPGLGGYAYRHAPAYQSLFPPLTGWALLADYDGDGHADLFAHAPLGIRVYHNRPAANGAPTWELVSEGLMSTGLSGGVNVQVPITDVPALTDVDYDGDLDILTFDLGGNYVQYFQNQSQERFGHARALVFRRVNSCWGNFEEGADCGDYDFSLDCPATGRHDPPPRNGLWASTSKARPQHAGSTLLALDLDGDGDKDILVGDVACAEIYQLTNEGTPQRAVFRRFTTHFPASKPIQFPTFPATFYEDVDFDGVKDLLAAPNVADNAGRQVNFGASAWWYRNRGTNQRPDFIYQQADFLQNTMVDLGEDTAPAFADVDADGDLDLLVGNAGLPRNEQTVATVWLFENVGTRQRPAFALRTDDFLGLSARQLTNLRPAFADLNGDGRTDFCFVGTRGQQTRLYTVPNAAALGRPFRFNPRRVQVLPGQLRPLATPALADLDGDGLTDLLVGTPAGSLSAYRGTRAKGKLVFSLQTDRLGNPSGDGAQRNLTPCVADLDGDGQLDLLTGDRAGQLQLYRHFTDNLTEFAAADVALLRESGANNQLKVGGMLSPAAADLDGDGQPEVVVGTNAGGLVWLRRVSK